MDPRLSVLTFSLCLAISASAQQIDHSDCAYAVTWCTDTVWIWNPPGTGSVADLNPTNGGCLASAERQGIWVRFTVASAGDLGFTILPIGTTDMDFAVWGPYATPDQCPTANPVRCSYAALGGVTGMSPLYTDATEGANGNSWVGTLPVQAGEHYLLYVDNYSMSGLDFTFTWGLLNGATLLCQQAPQAVMVASTAFVPPGGAVDFTDQSTNSPYAWSWTFDGGTPATSQQQHPSGIVFDSLGCHLVTLVVQNAAGADSIADACMVEVQTSTAIREQPTTHGFNVQQDAGGIAVAHNTGTQYNLVVFDAVGRCTLNVQHSGPARLLTGGWAKGHYMLVLQTAGEHATMRVFVR